MNNLSHVFAIVPAAGIGRRMNSEIPKQYLQIAGRSILEHTLQRLLSHPQIQLICVAISSTDQWWQQLAIAKHPKIIVTNGGMERRHSVLNALLALQEVINANDWVLVHDAVRPCIRSQDIDQLFQTLQYHPVGGLLGVMAKDTMKRADVNNVIQFTVPRASLWHAYTPQMFRYNLLQQALQHAVTQGWTVTDEAEAMERAGHKVQMVEGHADNIKITCPEDIGLAEFFMAQFV